MSDKKELNKQQLLFSDLYLANGFNATQAAKDAEYSEDTACEQGSRLLRNVKVREYLKKRINELLDNREELQKQWIDNVTEMAFYDLTGDSETDKYRANDKTKALELLGKYLTLFTEKKEVNHTTIDEDGNKKGIDYSKLTTEALQEIVNAARD